jgi:phosphopantothenate-cysteine ligase
VNVLVTGGGTVAPIDDVRTITNVSTGRFAATISESCLERGASVWHLHAPTAQLPIQRSARFDLDNPDPAAESARLRDLSRRWQQLRERLQLVPLGLGTVSEYAETLKGLLTSRPFDIAFLAMAVSDYEPVPRAGKLSSEASDLTIRCRRSPKVIRSVKDWAPSVFLVGFKLLSRSEPAELIRQAEASGIQNRADLTVANDLQTLTEGRHTVHLVRTGTASVSLPPGPDLADRLVERVFGLCEEARRAG